MFLATKFKKITIKGLTVALIPGFFNRLMYLISGIKVTPEDFLTPRRIYNQEWNSQMAGLLKPGLAGRVVSGDIDLDWNDIPFGKQLRDPATV